MSITRTERVVCSCGTPVEVVVADSLNAGRHPHLKQSILDRTLHAFTCGVCGQRFVIEKDLLYVDFERKQFFCMYPRRERAREAACSAEVKRAYQRWMGEQAPQFIIADGRDFLVRACFGYEELREKIVIDDAGLADLVVEALKIDILNADPWFRDANVMTLRLDSVLATGELRLVPEWLAPPEPAPGTAIERRVATVSRAIYDEIDARFDDILVTHPELAGGAHVSMLRLVSWPAVTPG
jgi:hypothetical protein